MTILVNVIGLIFIFLVIWWFWLNKKSKDAVKADSQMTIKVADGVYSPAVIKMKLGNTIILRFIREEENPCAEKVIFADFNQSADLPVGKPVDLSITPDKKGEFEFTCQMGMYRGKLIVE